MRGWRGREGSGIDHRGRREHRGKRGRRKKKEEKDNAEARSAQRNAENLVTADRFMQWMGKPTLTNRGWGTRAIIFLPKGYWLTPLARRPPSTARMWPLV